MKTFVAALAVLTTMLLGICLYSNYLTNFVEDITEDITQIQHTATDNRWDACKQKTKELTEKWESHKKALCFFTDHGDLDEVEKGLSELKTSTDFLDEADTIMYASKLYVLLDRLLKNEQPTLENILSVNTKTTNLSYYVITGCSYVRPFI